MRQNFSKTQLSRPAAPAASETKQSRRDLVDILNGSTPAKVGLDYLSLRALFPDSSTDGQNKQQLYILNPSGDQNTSRRNSSPLDKSTSYSLDAQPLPQGQVQNVPSPANMSSGQPGVCHSINQTVDGIVKVISELQRQTTNSKRTQSYQKTSQAVQLGLAAALQGFSACVQSISDTVQTALADTESNTEKLQKLLQTNKCPTNGFSMPATSSSEFPSDLNSKRHDQECTSSKGAQTEPQGVPHLEGCHITSRAPKSSYSIVGHPVVYHPELPHKLVRHATPRDSVPTNSYVSEGYENFSRQPRFPPLPTMGPLLPSREAGPFDTAKRIGKDHRFDGNSKFSTLAASASLYDWKFPEYVFSEAFCPFLGVIGQLIHVIEALCLEKPFLWLNA